MIRPQSCGRIGRAFPDIQIQKFKERFGGICAARRGYAAWLLFAARALPLIDIGKGLPIMVGHDKAGAVILDRPGREEAAAAIASLTLMDALLGALRQNAAPDC